MINPETIDIENPLEFNVASLMRDAVGASRALAVDADRIVFALDDVATDVDVGITLLRTNRGILASVRAGLTVGRVCSRCLAETTGRVDFAFAEEFLPVIDVATGRKVDFDDSVEAFRIDEHHILDLAEALRQYRVAAEPIAAVCADSCKGLCSTCGEDLNLAACACTAAPDDRWAALRVLAGTGDEKTSEDT